MAVDQTQYSVAMDTDPSSGYPMPKVSADITQVDAIVPVDVQNHLTSTVQTHNAVSIALSGNSINANWIPSDGFLDLSISITNDNNTTTVSGSIQWSFDGTNIAGAEQFAGLQAINAWGNSKSFAPVSVKAPYFKVALVNGDSAAAHTMSAWAYLKA